MVAVAVKPPPLAVTTILCLPTVALALILTVMVEVPDPGAAIGLGLKVMLMPAALVADRVTAELKPPPPVVVMVLLEGVPTDTEMEAGLAATFRVGLDAGARALIRPAPLGLPQPVTRS